MEIDPTYASVGTLFQFKPMFFVPKYQRAYSWEKDAIADFTKDLMNCFDHRLENNPVSHFFGGILSVKHSVSGAVNQHKYEIIDGQQRISSFILLAICIVRIYEELKQETINAGDTRNSEIIENRIKAFSERFIQFTQEIQRNSTVQQVLILSRRDHSFFTGLITGLSPAPEPVRDSHERIKQAYDIIYEKVRNKIDQCDSITEKIDRLEIFQFIIDTDFTVLHMVTPSKQDAYRLFQVINDRGTSLNDGDLLRAKTLELLERFNSQQDAVEQLWDEILKDPPKRTTDYLNWIYESYQGCRPSSNALFDLFMDAFYPQYQRNAIDLRDATAIHNTTNTLKDDICTCKKLEAGQWPYQACQPITGWDISRLNLLIIELEHTLSIPLLLAANKLEQKKFAEMVQLLERVFFRYKLICNQHVGPLKKIYYDESLAIRADPANYRVSSLKNKLQQLIIDKANDRLFKQSLESLEYKPSGGNKTLKYFLMTAEYYFPWFRNGAIGNAKVVDKSRVYDFSSMSIEHVYPQNAQGAVYDTSIEPHKNTLGNLTILDPGQNVSGNNASFSSKQRIFNSSSISITKEIATNSTWGIPEIMDNKNFLLEIASKIFSF